MRSEKDSELIFGASYAFRARFESRGLLVHGKTVQQPRTTRAHQIFLAAPTAGVGRIPRSVSTTLFVRVTKLRGSGGAARPVAACVIGRVGVGATVGLRSGEHIVLVRRVTDPVDHRSFFGQRQLLAERVAEPGLFDRVAVQLGDILRDTLTALVGPGTIPDPIARIDSSRTLRA